MFTGLVECMGKVVELRRGPALTRLGISFREAASQLGDGDSVAVDGVCLTVVSRGRDRFHADVIAETLARTTLDRIRVGSEVNLERALAVGDRLGGHLVQGHVDGISTVAERIQRGADYRLRVAMTPEIARFVAYKGSIALNGVSLTVSQVCPAWFEVALVPKTLSATTLGRLRRPDPLNVEVDLLARYLERLIEEREFPSRQGGS